MSLGRIESAIRLLGEAVLHCADQVANSRARLTPKEEAGLAAHVNTYDKGVDPRDAGGVAQVYLTVYHHAACSDRWIELAPTERERAVGIVLHAEEQRRRAR